MIEITNFKLSAISPVALIIIFLLLAFLISFFFLGAASFRLNKRGMHLLKHLKIENANELSIEAFLKNDFTFIQRLLTTPDPRDSPETIELKAALNQILTRRNVFFAICVLIFFLLCLTIVIFGPHLKVN
jgi:hypothetical protein